MPISRRKLLGGGAVVAAAAGIDAFAVEPHWLDVTVHDVPLTKLPSALDGFTIAQVTDAHLDRLGYVEEAILRAVREYQVQLLALTGDIIDSARRLDVLREFCSALRTPGMTMLATLGNWEHWGRVSPSELASAYRASDTKLLVNEALTLPDGVRVFASDDSTGGDARLSALGDQGADASLILTHSPEILDRMPAEVASNSLALAGHTHGGQVRLGADAVPFVPAGSGRFVAGWYDVPTGRAYVSRGTGTSIVPVRFTCRPELPILRLRRA